jgi:hypothetical protein
MFTAIQKTKLSTVRVLECLLLDTVRTLGKKEAGLCFSSILYTVEQKSALENV